MFDQSSNDDDQLQMVEYDEDRVRDIVKCQRKFLGPKLGKLLISLKTALCLCLISLQTAPRERGSCIAGIDREKLENAEYFYIMYLLATYR